MLEAERLMAYDEPPFGLPGKGFTFISQRRDSCVLCHSKTAIGPVPVTAGP
jgi:hypothetical protein